MISIIAIKKRLDATEALVRRFPEITVDIESGEFLERITTIRKELDVMPGETTESEKESLDSQTLLTDVELKLIGSMISTLRTIHPLPDIITTLQSVSQHIIDTSIRKKVSVINGYIDEFVKLTGSSRVNFAANTFEMQKPTSLPTASNEVVSIVIPHKKVKVRKLAEITGPALKIEELRAELSAQLTEHELQLQTVRTICSDSAMIQASKTVPLIAYKLKEIGSALQQLQLDESKKESSQLVLQ